jgi:hypothetical protein
MVDIGLTKRDVGDSLLRNTMFCLDEGFPGDINRDKFRTGTVPGKEDGLGPNTACSLEHPAPWRVTGVVVEQLS